jgi:hypothetical protein
LGVVGDDDIVGHARVIGARPGHWGHDETVRNGLAADADRGEKLTHVVLLSGDVLIIRKSESGIKMAK